jgi:hypothetical protein
MAKKSRIHPEPNPHSAGVYSDSAIETEKADTEPEKDNINYICENKAIYLLYYRWKSDGLRIGVGSQLPHALHELLRLVTVQKKHRYGSQRTKKHSLFKSD